eukprot:m.214627 g.214627  ORF g.214627 m.214627 type:complete len:510 (-) comp13799_c0_seq19:451-1980(-)
MDINDDNNDSGGDEDRVSGGWFDVRHANECWFESCKLGSRSMIKECVGSGCVDVVDVDKKRRNGLHHLLRSHIPSKRKLSLFMYIFNVSDQNTVLLFQRDEKGVQPLGKLWKILERVEKRQRRKYSNGESDDRQSTLLLTEQVRKVIEDATEAQWFECDDGSDREDKGGVGIDTERSFRDRLSDAFRDDAEEFGEGDVYREWERYRSPFSHHGAPNPQQHQQQGEGDAGGGGVKHINEMSDDEYAAYMRRKMFQKRNGVGEDDGYSGNRRKHRRGGKRKTNVSQSEDSNVHMGRVDSERMKRFKEIERNIQHQQELAEISSYVERCETFFNKLKSLRKQQQQHGEDHSNDTFLLEKKDIPFPSLRVIKYLNNVVEEIAKRKLTALSSGEVPSNKDGKKVTLSSLSTNTSSTPISSSSLSSTTLSSTTSSQKQKQNCDTEKGKLELSPEDRVRLLVKQSQRWWHPDTWTSRYSSYFADESDSTDANTSVMDKVLDTSKYFNDLRTKTHNF